MTVSLKSMPLEHRNHDRLHQKGKRSSYTLTTSPLPQANVALCAELSPETPVPPVAKENPGGQPAPPNFVDHFVGTPTLISHHESSGEPVGLTHWECYYDGKA